MDASLPPQDPMSPSFGQSPAAPAPAWPPVEPSAFGLTAVGPRVVRAVPDVERPSSTSGLAVAGVTLAVVVTFLQVVTALTAVRIAVDIQDGATYIQASRPLALVSLLAVGGQLVLLLASWIVNGIWLMHAQRNARVFDNFATGRLQGGWCIGAWAVPVGALWMPFQIVKDLRRAAGRAPRGLLGWWWTTWLLTAWIAPWLFSGLPDKPAGDGAGPEIFFAVLASVASVVSVVLWAVIVRGVVQAQDAQLARHDAPPR